MPPKIVKVEEPYSGVSVEHHVTLDWYERLGIPVVESAQKAEWYKSNNVLIELQNESYVCFLNDEQYDDYCLDADFIVLEAIEKLAIVYEHRQHFIEKPPFFNDGFPFLKHAGYAIKQDQFRINDFLLWIMMAKLDLDDLVQRVMALAKEGEQFIFQRRSPWRISVSDFELQYQKCLSRFAFGFVNNIVPLSEGERNLR